MSLFITFEGTEGSGKTTQIGMLAQSLRGSGYQVVTTREPGGTELGEALRRLLLESETAIGPEAEAYLMTGARAEHVRHVIRPALERGDVVLCDRFVDSTFAYQGGGRRLPVHELRLMQSLAIGETTPDLTILVDVPAEVGLERRAKAREVNRIDRESLEFHARVAFWYRQEARANPDRWVVVDGSRSPADVHVAILRNVIERLNTDGVVRHRSGER
ncbi:MAG TPA: dTMP kinase [Thermomicrobiales bacterium]|nr:dTMP kinase [Thermomicrobiales bacterium]